MKLEIENCKCGGHGCTGKLLILDGSLMDGIHDAETATALQTAVNLHDELVEALQVAYTGLRDDRYAQFNDARAFADRLGIYHGDLQGGERVLAEIAKAVLAKVEGKGK